VTDKTLHDRIHGPAERMTKARAAADPEAVVAELAKLPHVKLSLCLQEKADLLGITKTELKESVREHKRKQAADTRTKKKVAAETPDLGELWRSAGHIINHPRILDLFAADLRREIAGEKINGQLLYLVATSRLFDHTMHAAIKGTSAGGKSEIRKRMLEYFPPESVVTFTSLSEKALLYFEGDFAHKIFSMGEAVATEEQSFQDYLLRELMSEGRLKHSTAQKVGDEIRTVTIEKEGPVAFMVTTTKAKLHPENETRMLSLEIDDGERQTKNVLAKVAEVRGLNHQTAINYEPWRNFQRWLELGDRDVVVPYADTLAEMVPPAAVRLRRDFGQVLCAIKAHALLHREQRARDKDGQIVADIENDYGTVRGLMAAILAEGAGVAVNPAMVETIAAVGKATATLPIGEGASAQDIGKILKLDKSVARRRLLKARDEGFVVNLEVRKGMQGKYRSTQQEVEKINILSATDELAEKYGSAVTPLKSAPPCHREEIDEADLEDDGGKAGGKDGGKPVASEGDRWHGGKPVASPLATVIPMDGNGKSPPVARRHGNLEGIPENKNTESDGAGFWDEPAADTRAEVAVLVPAGTAPVAPATPAPDLTIPGFLDRRHELHQYEPKWRPGLIAGTLTDKDIGFMEGGEFK
jgi:hypothetical protein